MTKEIMMTNLTIDGMRLFFNEMAENMTSDREVIFNFEKCHKARLLPALVIGSWMKSISATKSVKNINHTHGGNYLENIGFFKYLKVRRFEDQVILIDKGKSHLPIIRISKDDYFAFDQDKDINESITERMKEVAIQVANIITTNSTEDHEKIVKGLTFILREIVRNVFEHSQTDYHYIAMQTQKNHNRIEIAIIDEGVGIVSSFTTNRKFTNYVLNSKNGIKRALVAGSSRFYENEIEIEKKETSWENSGHGLYVTSKLCARAQGSFNLISSGWHLNYEYDELDDSYVEVLEPNPFEGCAIGLEFSLSSLKEYSVLMTKIKDEIEESQKGYGNLYKEPSSYSFL